MKELIKTLLNLKDAILICSPAFKTKLLEELARTKTLVPFTFKTYQDLVSDLLGNYHLQARLELAKSEGISPELADIKLKNSLLVNDSYQNPKIYELLKIRSRYQKYLDYNPYAIKLYEKRNIILVNYFHLDDCLNRALEILKTKTNIIHYQIKKENQPLKISCFSNYKQEVLFVLKEVVELLKAGVKPEKIRIHQVPSQYKTYLKEVFALAEIALEFKTPLSLYEFEIVQNFLEVLKGYLDYSVDTGFPLALEELYVKKDNPLVFDLINVLNRYMDLNYLVKDIYQDLKYELQESKVRQESFSNCIYTSNLLEANIEEDDHLFILGFSQDLFPRTSFDDDYLNDIEKEKQGLLTSQKANYLLKRQAQSLLSSTSNLHISYAKQVGKESFSLSSLYNKTDTLIKVEERINGISLNLDLLQLGKLLDLYRKYKVTSEELFSLFASYPDSGYISYRHQFTGISPKLLSERKASRYSYTALDTYYTCAFRYYLERVLKIKRKSNEDALFIGNLFHACLESLPEEGVLDIDAFLREKINSYLQENEKIPSAKERFFIEKYIDVLKRFYSFLQKEKSNSKFQLYSKEEKFSILVNEDSFEGKIDKVLTLYFNGEKYALVIDYKSGSAEFDLNKIIYGLNMQIMVYFYLLRKSLKENIKFAGGYLQQVLPNSVFNANSKLSYHEQFQQFFRRNGYSTDNQELLNKIDYHFGGEASFLQGIRLTKSGDFHATSMRRVLSDDVFEKLLSITERKIEEAIKAIKAGEFPINPKMIGRFDSCAYCQYYDLCNRDYNDYQNLKEYKAFEFLEEEK